MAKSVRSKKSFEPMEQKVGQDKPRDLPTTGDAHLDAPVIEPVQGPDWKQKAAALAFLEEHVTIMLHDTTDKNAERIVQFAVNGRNQYIMRNVPTTVRRKYVECIARAKMTTYSQEHYKDANGNDAIRNVPHTALRYPFSVIEDRNPQGGAWLQAVLAEG